MRVAEMRQVAVGRRRGRRNRFCPCLRPTPFCLAEEATPQPRRSARSLSLSGNIQRLPGMCRIGCRSRPAELQVLPLVNPPSVTRRNNRSRSDLPRPASFRRFVCGSTERRRVCGFYTAAMMGRFFRRWHTDALGQVCFIAWMMMAVRSLQRLIGWHLKNHPAMRKNSGPGR
jgi:hypothetical protein